MTKYIKMVCSHCGSDQVTRDGLLEWSIALQSWVVAGELDNTDCNVCGGQTSLREEEVDDS